MMILTVDFRYDLIHGLCTLFNVELTIQTHCTIPDGGWQKIVLNSGKLSDLAGNLLPDH
jgi:hypothetical protein